MLKRLLLLLLLIAGGSLGLAESACAADWGHRFGRGQGPLQQVRFKNIFKALRKGLSKEVVEGSRLISPARVAVASRRLAEDRGADANYSALGWGLGVLGVFALVLRRALAGPKQEGSDQVKES